MAEKGLIERIEDWNAGRRVETVTLGGNSLWYEQAIQILLFEALASELKSPTGPALSDVESLREYWLEELKQGKDFPSAWWGICKRMKLSCGYEASYNQGGAAFAFARRLLAFGPEVELAKYDALRKYSTSKRYPFHKMFCDE